MFKKHSAAERLPSQSIGHVPRNGGGKRQVRLTGDPDTVGFKRRRMATQNNLHVPDDLLAQAQSMAETEGRTADDLAAEALRRYLTLQRMTRLSRGAEERRRALGLKTDEEVQEYVDRVIHEARRERR